MNESIKNMLTKPGIHCVGDKWFGKLHGRYVKVEVEPDGTCHQLNQKLERDGILSPENWKNDAIEIEDPENESNSH